MRKFMLAIPLIAVSSMAFGAAFTTGDVFASIGSGRVAEFTPGGTLVQTLNDGTGATFTTGSAFDSAQNFYVTNFGSAGVSKFNSSGVLVAGTFLATGGVTTPESILATTGGDFFVGGPGTPAIDEYNSAGTLVHTFNVSGVGTGTGGTDWIDEANATTMLYIGEGYSIKSYDIATNTQNADVTSSLPTYSYALRVIPGGADAGDILVAGSSAAYLLSSTGTVLKTYSLPGNGGTDFSLNLDPNGTDFWTGDATSGLVWEVNIATGAIDQQWNTGAPGTFFGLAVLGELTTSTSTPEPSSIVLFGTLIAIVGWSLRKKLA